MPKRPRSKNQKGKGESLHDLFLNKLKVLYDVESEIIKAIPKMAKAATDKKLKAGFTQHLAETKNQAKRLEQIFREMDMKPVKLKSEAIRGLAKDADWVIKNVKDPQALDANLIAAAQYVEHYEIAGYGTAREWAQIMGHDNAIRLLDETLKEESATDKKLTELAVTDINEMANDMKE